MWRGTGVSMARSAAVTGPHLTTYATSRLGLGSVVRVRVGVRVKEQPALTLTLTLTAVTGPHLTTYADIAASS